MDDEPNAGQDILDMVIGDSQSQIDNEIAFCAYRIMNTNLFDRNFKIQFLKASE